jgi:DNA helicase IV
MAVRQTDSEPSAKESAKESTGDRQATESEGSTHGAGSPAARDAAPAGDAGDAADGPAAGYAAAVRAEQEYVTMLYDLLDQARERSSRYLAGVRAGGGAGGTHQARLERDISAAEHAKRLAQLDLTERGLCFGRTDDEKRNTLYIGRIGLRDDDYELKLIDWRAPAARPFYAATPRNPVGLVRRRHIYTRRRAVTGVDDEVFDLDKLSESDKRTLSGEAALIAAVSSGRTGRMADVVATIQAEQDRVIRADLPGVLVVQGGPGTGKTVAALHRAAYLLYTHRRVLERRGVLVIGPNATFLRYISQVLPSLGETDVVLHTLGDLFPGVHATDTRDPAAVIKGDERMVRVLQQAVRDRQAVPKRDIIVNAEGVDVPLAREAILRARDRARSTRKPHNVARKLFVTELLTDLARAEARVLNRPLDEQDLPDARARLWDTDGVNAALDALWPLLTPEMLLAALLRSPQAIRSAAGPVLDAAERERLNRSDHPSRWTVADVPLLDEAAELLGVDDSAQQAARRAAERARRAEREYAQEVLDSAIVGGMEFSMTVSQLGMLDAERLSDWNSGGGVAFSTAERAAADRTWAYGHVIIDEAQELSPMAWRMVLRRNPARSMTVVGDVAQTGSPAGATSWKDMLTPLVGRRWREERLTVNYRTPAEIMAVAADVLASVSPAERPPDSVRSEGVAPRAVRVPDAGAGAGPAGLAAAVASAVRADLAEIGGADAGRLAVIAPDAVVGSLAPAIPDAIPGDRPESLDSAAALLTVAQAKGLEFDRVIVADPSGILAQSQNGGHDLYVAVTRATHRLTVVYEGELPGPLRSLSGVKTTI